MIKKNSEILFIYDAKLSNPNGDMDNENKPRMDYDTQTNLVSDVRLKRYMRDYLETGLEKMIFITNKAKDSKDRYKQLEKTCGKNATHTDFIDVRFFGAVFAIEGKNEHLTGPIQFNWGYSLNKVELNDSSTITSSFSSGEGIGKDYRVKYSLIAFNGSINANVAQYTKLGDDDVLLFDKVILKSIQFNRTRSKIGQTPRFYMRVEFNNTETFLNDLREYIKLEFNDEINEYQLRNIDEFTLDIKKLVEYLEKFDSKIKNIHYWFDNSLKIDGFDKLKVSFKEKLIEKII